MIKDQNIKKIIKLCHSLFEQLIGQINCLTSFTSRIIAFRKCFKIICENICMFFVRIINLTLCDLSFNLRRSILRSGDALKPKFIKRQNMQKLALDKIGFSLILLLYRNFI